MRGMQTRHVADGIAAADDAIADQSPRGIPAWSSCDSLCAACSVRIDGTGHSHVPRHGCVVVALLHVDLNALARGARLAPAVQGIGDCCCASGNQDDGRDNDVRFHGTHSCDHGG